LRFEVVRIDKYLRRDMESEGTIELTGEGVSTSGETEYFKENVLPYIENPIINLTDDEVDCTEDWEGWLDALYYILNEEVKFILR
jgi:hypothetical protein